MGSVSILNRVDREGLTEKVTSEQIRLKLGKGGEKHCGQREQAVQRP